MSLINFFAPLNFQTIFISFCLLFLFDIIGTYIINIALKIDNKNIRILNWLVGFGFFMFIWFLLSFFIPYSRINIFISILFLLVLTLPRYIKYKNYREIINEIWFLRLPILIILPFLPAIFVKASLPPYYSDEMAYHFISPFAVTHLKAISYTGGIYADLPRIMNMFYEIIFSLASTYSIARIFHFLILVTSMLYTFKILKLSFNWFTGFAFVLIFFSLPQEIVLTSTLGYIDVAAYSFILIAISSFIGFYKFRSIDYLYVLSIFWAMNLGTKYTGVSTFFVFVIMFLTLWLIDPNCPLKLIKPKILLKIVILLLTFGGYWYLKNFIWYGNPIFPFIFKCWGSHIETCPQMGGFFGTWTTQITFNNLYLILSQLFVKNKILHLLVAMIPLFCFYIKDFKTKIITFFMFACVLIELLLLKYFSGFYIRYQQHLQLYLLMSIVIMLTSELTNKTVQFISKIMMALLILVTISLYIYNITYFNSLKFLTWEEINYSIGRINIYNWIDNKFPAMKYTIKWCENSDNGKSKKLARFDPDLIWFDYDGLKRVFILNCDYINPPLYDQDIKKIIPSAIENKLQFYIASKGRCISDDNVVKLHPTERDDMLYLRKINNKIICNSKEIEPNLYYFDYTKL